MEIPKFLMGDNSEYPESIFVVHTEFPRFVIDLKDDEISIMEDLDEHDREEFEIQMAKYVEEATHFYDKEIATYED
ncbi:MAG: hypothetical protein HRT66_06095 [Flavobacteriaceae bacterium]|nr:hypothetical protein [Flavobacteriaceae bacterium]